MTTAFSLLIMEASGTDPLACLSLAQQVVILLIVAHCTELIEAAEYEQTLGAIYSDPHGMSPNWPSGAVPTSQHRLNQVFEGQTDIPKYVDLRLTQRESCVSLLCATACTEYAPPSAAMT